MTTTRTGAEVLLRTLIAGGVGTCFASPGTSEMHFVAALDRIPGIRCVLGLQETAVTGMADGHYRVRGRPAATLLQCGPGLANGIANLHNARRAAPCDARGADAARTVPARRAFLLTRPAPEGGLAGAAPIDQRSPARMRRIRTSMSGSATTPASLPEAVADAFLARTIQPLLEGGPEKGRVALQTLLKSTDFSFPARSRSIRRACWSARARGVSNSAPSAARRISR